MARVLLLYGVYCTCCFLTLAHRRSIQNEHQPPLTLQICIQNLIVLPNLSCPLCFGYTAYSPQHTSIYIPMTACWYWKVFCTFFHNTITDYTPSLIMLNTMNWSWKVCFLHCTSITASMNTKGAIHNCQHLNECTKHTFLDPSLSKSIHINIFQVDNLPWKW